jgi:hypothetical protein
LSFDAPPLRSRGIGCGRSRRGKCCLREGFYALDFFVAAPFEKPHPPLNRIGENVFRVDDFSHLFLLFAENPCRESGKGARLCGFVLVKRGNFRDERGAQPACLFIVAAFQIGHACRETIPGGLD